MLPPSYEPRPHCFRCDKPQSMCLCGAVRSLPNQVRLHVLQHRRESRHAIGTVRLLKLGLDAVHVHVLPSGTAEVDIAPIDLPSGAGLLYPADDAIELAHLSEEDRPTDLVVIDGTWSHAHRIHRDNPWLHALPHYKLSPEQGSRYRIRTEPRQECLSTVEAVIEALRVLEPELEGTEALLEAFDTMIDAQIEARAAHSHSPRRKRKRDKPRRIVPEGLRRPAGRIVVVYAEAAQNPDSWTSSQEVCRLTAMTLDGHRTFDTMVESTVPPDPVLLGYFGLSEGTTTASVLVATAHERFVEFCGHRDVTLVAWGPWVLRYLRAAWPDTTVVSLKDTWASLARTTVPGLPAVIAGLDLPATEVSHPGRAAERVGAAHALLVHLLATAPS